MVILVFIAVGIAQAVWNTYRLRDQLTVEGDFHNTVRLALAVIEKDVSQIFSAHLSMPDAKEKLTPEDTVNLQTVLRTDIERPSDFFGGIISKTGIRPTRFVGSKDKMSFLTSSHRRIYKDSAESVFTKITYQLEENTLPNPGETEAKRDQKILVKTSNTNAFDLDDDDRDPKIKRYGLIPNVVRFELKYYRHDKEQWIDRWDSDKAEFKNIFPDLIELVIEVREGEKLRFVGNYHFKPECPLNGLSSTL